MNSLIKKLQENPILAILSTIVLGVIVIEISSLSAKPITAMLENHLALNLYTKNTVFKLFILLYSIIAILLINKGKLSDYGFCKPTKVNYVKLTLNVIGITTAAFIVGMITFMVILSRLFPTGNNNVFPEFSSIMQMILTVWIWSSLCEEVLVRGLVQGFIQRFQSLKFLRLSIPVLVSGFFFGAMHLSLLSKGMSEWFVAFIVFNASVIGFMAAYYREKTGSLIPSFWVHFIANIVGAIPLIIKMIVAA